MISSNEIDKNDIVSFKVEDIQEFSDGTKAYKLGDYYVSEDTLINRMKAINVQSCAITNAVAAYPMPKLETGMFIILDLTNTERKEKYYGFVYNDKIIWQHGGWDEVQDIHIDKRREDDIKAKLTIYEKDKLYYFPDDNFNFKDYILWTGEAWY